MNYIYKYRTLATIFLLLVSCNKNSGTNSQIHSLQLSNGYFKGTLHDNISNKKRQGSGFTPLTHYLYSDQNIFRNDAVGLNFEHIMNGTAMHADISMFTPRKDSCRIELINDSSAVIIHPANYSSWNIR